MSEVRITFRPLAICEWYSGLASKNTNPFASLASCVFSSHWPFLYIWPDVFDLASKNAELLASLASVLKNLSTPLHVHDYFSRTNNFIVVFLHSSFEMGFCLKRFTKSPGLLWFFVPCSRRILRQRSEMPRQNMSGFLLNVIVNNSLHWIFLCIKLFFKKKYMCTCCFWRIKK
jgi:hypothetical protein